MPIRKIYIPKTRKIYQGIEIIFKAPLRRMSNGIGLEGVFFLFEDIEAYNLKKKAIILKNYYEAFQPLSDFYKEALMFASVAPNTSIKLVRKNTIARITELNSGLVIYES